MRQHLPNALTITRFLILLVCVSLLVRSSDAHDALVAVLLAIAAITDYADGAIARAFDARTAFGTRADPLIDKLFIGSITAALSFHGRLPWLAVGILSVRQLVFWIPPLLRLTRLDLDPTQLGRLSAVVLYAALFSLVATPQHVMWPVWLFWSGVALALADVPLKARRWTRRRGRRLSSVAARVASAHDHRT